MEILIICTVAFTTSILTFFSGFGLGTILTPVMMIFFPTETAIGLTAVVHLLNNLFKLFLVGKKADFSVVWQFGIPAVIAAFLGAWLLNALPQHDTLFSYTLGEKPMEVTTVKFVIAVLLFLFALIEFSPFLERIPIHRNLLPLGGTLSGFFGGLSGHQGALRSAFLIRTGLSKEALIGTTVILSCLVDFTRIGVYAGQWDFSRMADYRVLLLSTTVSAFAGAYLGNRLLRKVTLRFVQTIVAVAIMVLAIFFALGLV